MDKVMPFITEETLHKPILKEVDADEDEDDARYNVYPIHLAIESGNLSLIRIMIQRGADVNKMAVLHGGSTVSCLSLAANQGNIEIVRFLLDNGALVNHGSSLCTPAEDGDEELVKILLEAGEDPNRPGADGETPLYKAIKEGHKKIKKILLNAGADLRFAKFYEVDEKRKKKKQKDLEEKERQEKKEEEEARKKREEEERKKREEEERKKKEEAERRRKTEPRTIIARSMTPELKEVNINHNYSVETSIPFQNPLMIAYKRTKWSGELIVGVTR